jgi:transmembrane sensor
VIDSSDGGVVLHAGDAGIVQPTGEVVTERGSVGDDDIAWTRGRLVFREAPLSEVTDALERWYGLTLRVMDTSTARLHVSTQFAGEPADEVLRQLGLVLGAEIQRQGDTAFVRRTRVR